MPRHLSHLTLLLPLPSHLPLTSSPLPCGHGFGSGTGGAWMGAGGVVLAQWEKVSQKFCKGVRCFTKQTKPPKETETPPFISDLQDSQGADLQQLLQPLWLLLLWKFFNHLCVHQHFCRGCWWLRCCWWWLGETFQDLLGMLRSVTSLSWKLCCFG